MEINVFNQYPNEIVFDFSKIIIEFSNYFKIDKSVSVILVDEESIKDINKEYRGIDRATDVISFEEDEEDYLGDIFICIDKVYEQALSYGHSNEREFAFLLVHGLLHLQGYDHNDPVEEKAMFDKQDEILNELNYRRENL